jgi:serine/threonine-protein kinase
MTRGPLPIPQAIANARLILDALRFAHRHGIIHRDIKPHNVLIGDGRLKVTDFGIARHGPSQMTEAGSIMGTAQYLSPEQARGAPVTAASDLYSVGVVLYEMLTGKVPFSGDTAIEIAMRHLNDVPKPPSRIRPEVPPALDQIVLRALAKEPEDRYQSADEFIEDLQRVEAGLPLAPETSEAATALLTGVTVGGTTEVLPTDTAATQVTPPRPRPYAPRRPPPYTPGYRYEEPPPKRRRILPWLLVAALLAAAAIAGWYVYTQIQDQLGGDTVPVPLVEGQKEKVAKTNIEKAGLEWKVIRTASTAFPVGVVGDQDPEAGVRIAEGDTVIIYVSTGPPKTVVPNVVGMNFEDAVDELKQANLEWRKREVFSTKPVGRVLAQNPDAGEQVPEGTEIVLRVSKGEQMIAVPDVLEQSEASARAELEHAGFTVQVLGAPSNDTPEGLVFAQSPDPGTDAPKGSTVQITVSTGPESVTVPNVEGQAQDSAEVELKNAGFKVQKEKQDTDDPLLDGVVLDQDPEGETEAPRGSTVIITVGKFTGPGGP